MLSFFWVHNSTLDQFTLQGKSPYYCFLSAPEHQPSADPFPDTLSAQDFSSTKWDREGWDDKGPLGTRTPCDKLPRELVQTDREGCLSLCVSDPSLFSWSPDAGRHVHPPAGRTRENILTGHKAKLARQKRQEEKLICPLALLMTNTTKDRDKRKQWPSLRGKRINRKALITKIATKVTIPKGLAYTDIFSC